jgi:hypothetical protein
VLNNATSRALDANIEQEKECIVCVDTIVYEYVMSARKLRLWQVRSEGF